MCWWVVVDLVAYWWFCIDLMVACLYGGWVSIMGGLFDCGGFACYGICLFDFVFACFVCVLIYVWLL